MLTKYVIPFIFIDWSPTNSRKDKIIRFFFHVFYTHQLELLNFHLIWELEHFTSGKTFWNKEVENGFSNFFLRKPQISLNMVSKISLLLRMQSLKMKVITLFLLILNKFDWDLFFYILSDRMQLLPKLPNLYTGSASLMVFSLEN